MKKCFASLYNGLIKENPTFVLMLGMCPTLAVTTSAMNGVGMGLTTTAVLIMSNIMISMLRRVIPDGVRIPAFIVVIASFVTITELLLKAYIPSLYEALGLYIPLIVVNCIILGRAESFASKNNMIYSAFDGLGMGLGFTLGLTCIGIVRELIGAGTVFGYRALPDAYEPLTIFILAPGAFLVLAFLVALMNRIKLAAGRDTGVTGDCDKLCRNCPNTGCGGRMRHDGKADSAEGRKR
ncbi:MAG: electron transport complex subunit E [Lachnospiraceae bacterium]|nr:electron transport complex subunit E [Lachnospiraceae bacterium]